MQLDHRLPSGGRRPINACRFGPAFSIRGSIAWELGGRERWLISSMEASHAGGIAVDDITLTVLPEHACKDRLPRHWQILRLHAVKGLELVELAALDVVPPLPAALQARLLVRLNY